MALPVISNVYRCAFNWQAPSGGQTATNVMHFRAAGLTATDVFTALDDAASSPMFGQIADGCAVTELIIQKLDGGSAAQSFDLSTSWVGTAAGVDQWIPGTSLVLTLKTAFAGRSARGRVYLPFIDEGAVSNGLIVASSSSIAGTWNTFRTTVEADGVDWVVASYTNATASDVTNVAVNQAAGTQRRRQSRLRS